MAHPAPIRISWPPTLWLLIAAAAAIAAATGLASPPIGIPMIVGIAAYAGIAVSRPDKILRGQTLSPSRQRRAAAIAGLGMLALTASFSGAASALRLAALLELRLRDQIETALASGTAQPGRTFRECERVVCAQATIIQLPTGHTLGIARLSGFALHDETPYGWRSATARAPQAERRVRR